MNHRIALAVKRRNILRQIIDLIVGGLGCGETEAVRQQRYMEVVARFGGMIDRICFGYSRSVVEMEDLRQDVLLNLWESMHKFKGECAMKSWVYRLTLNVCVSTLRKRYRSVATDGISDIVDLADCDDENKERLAALHEAIGRLNPIDKAVVVLWLEEEPYESIAEITGLSKVNVATRIHRAKAKLKTLIEE